MHRIAVAAALLLAGCSSTATTNAVSADVAAAEVTLTAAEQLALTYTSLPRCSSLAAASPVCSSQATVDKIKALDNTAFQAVRLARSNAAMLPTAIAAIGVLRSAVPGS